MKKILVVDGNSIINRAFYGIRALSTKSGKPTNAIYGTVQILHRQLLSLDPDYCAVAFDVHAPTFRKVMYPEYKAGRHPTPPELLSQFDDAKECLRLMGMHILELEGYEADDLQGTVARMAEQEEDLHAYILSGDRDLLQLISPKISVLLATNADTLTFDPDAFAAKYGVPPHALVDVKALMGDSSDNIPGVPGIGEKTAYKLIAAFQSLAGVYEHLEDPLITRGMREKLISGKASAELSYRLARIHTEVPIERDLESLRRMPCREGALYRKFQELEFFGLIRKFGLEADAAEEHTTAAEAPAIPATVPVRTVTAEALLALLSPEAPFAVAFSEEGLTFAVNAEENLRYEGAYRALAPFFAPPFRPICFDAKKLYHFLSAQGISLSCIPHDLMLYAYGLDSSAVFDSVQEFLAQWAGTAVPERTDSYAHLLVALLPVMRRRAEEDGVLSLIEDVELPLAPILAEMEETGFCIDAKGMEALSEELRQAVADTAERIYWMAGLEFNINSAKQLSLVLTEELQIPLKKKTKQGYATDAETLEQVRAFHPIIDEILYYRKVSKLHSTYTVGLLKAMDKNGRVHTEFKQALTATGRLSSVEPNLQNIPVKTEEGRKIRSQFIPKSHDYVLVDADYSQIELRLLAAFSGDETMLHAFRHGEDIHAKTASAVFGVPEEAVTEELRKRAKAVNFGIVYGMGAFSLAGDLKISITQAKHYIESYFAGYPKIRSFLDGAVKDAEEKGYASTLFGRRRYIPELSSSHRNQKEFGRRVAMNSPLQGSAADIIKLAMIRTANALKEAKLDAKLVMQVHDELILECHREHAEAAARILKQSMEEATVLPIPLTVDLSISDRWI